MRFSFPCDLVLTFRNLFRGFILITFDCFQHFELTESPESDSAVLAKWGIWNKWGQWREWPHVYIFTEAPTRGQNGQCPGCEVSAVILPVCSLSGGVSGLSRGTNSFFLSVPKCCSGAFWAFLPTFRGASKWIWLNLNNHFFFLLIVFVILLTVAYLWVSVCVTELEFVATCSYIHLIVLWLSSITWADYFAASLCSPASLVMALYAGWSWADRVHSILRAVSENSCLLWPKRWELWETAGSSQNSLLVHSCEFLLHCFYVHLRVYSYFSFWQNCVLHKLPYKFSYRHIFCAMKSQLCLLPALVQHI